MVCFSLGPPRLLRDEHSQAYMTLAGLDTAKHDLRAIPRLGVGLHRISPGFTVHYQDLEYWAKNSEKHAGDAFLAWIMCPGKKGFGDGLYIK
jgi:hypothetical protein